MFHRGGPFVDMKDSVPRLTPGKSTVVGCSLALEANVDMAAVARTERSIGVSKLDETGFGMMTHILSTSTEGRNQVRA
jgi:hypothetical protein